MNRNVILAAAVGIIVGVTGAGTYAVLGTSQNATSVNHNQIATDKLRSLKGDAFDKAFLAEMITHHQGAIDMAALIDANARHDELKRLGKDIKAAQSKEIDMMQSWQTDWGYKNTPKSHNMHAN